MGAATSPGAPGPEKSPALEASVPEIPPPGIIAGDLVTLLFPEFPA